MSYTILNASGEIVTTHKEARDFFKYDSEVVFLGGYPNSYILLTTKSYESLEIAAEFLLGGANELYNANSEYWYGDTETGYSTFGDQFCIIETWNIERLKTELRKIGK